jgi:hypothetical protein
MGSSTSVTNERPTFALSVEVRDITGEEDKYTLDSHGFQLLHHETQVTDFREVEVLRKDYFPEIEQVLKDV